MSAGALALDGLTRRYADGPPAVDRLTLEVARGELLALVGASGSGKSTTLRMIAGYEVPDGGRVVLDGRDITALPPQRRGFGMVFQHYALFPHLSVEDNVAFGLEARGVRRSERLTRARQALAGVGLEGAGRRQVQSLSGGEQQRVALARAVVIEPPVLLLDEPLSNLDPTLRETMRDELRQMLQRLGVTAVFVTHDQEDAFAVADRVALLRHGVLLQLGTPEALYDRPASRAVAEFIGRGALLPAADHGTHADVRVGDRTLRLRVTRPPEQTAGDGAASVVIRPEALALAPPDATDAWVGEIRARRFAAGLTVYTVALPTGADGGDRVEIVSPERDAQIGARVGVRVMREPVALVRA